MKKMFLFALAAVAVTVFSAGCSSTSVVTNRFGQQIEMRMQKVTFAPEITVGDKYVSGTSSTTVYCGFIRIGETSKQAVGVSFSGDNSFWGSADAYQRAAIYDACLKSKADILIAPQYTTTAEGNFFKKTVSCTVKGFPGFIKGVKLLPPCPQQCPQQCPKAPAAK